MVVVLAAAAGGAYMYSQGQYYVTPSSDNKQVLLYQGMSQLSFAASQQSMSEGPLWINSVPQSKRADLYKTAVFSSKDALWRIWTSTDRREVLRGLPAQPAGHPVRRSSRVPPASRRATHCRGRTSPPRAAASSKDGAPLANGPVSNRARTTARLPRPAPSASTGGVQGSPEPQNPTSSPSTPASQPGDDPQMKAYCAGTTDGPQ